jgi:hypothetical protein
LEKVIGITSRKHMKRLKKHLDFTLHVITTIQLDLKNSVPLFTVSENYTNGSVLEEFILNKNLGDHVKYDIINRHGSHKAVQANINCGTIPFWEAYQECYIEEDFTQLECLLSILYSLGLGVCKFSS